MLYKFWNNNYNIGWGTRIWTGNARVRAASFTVKLSPIFLLYYQWLKIFYFSVYYLCVFFYLIIPSTYYKAQNGVKLFLKKFKPNYLVINFPHISINTVFNPTDLNFPIKCLAPYNWWVISESGVWTIELKRRIRLTCCCKTSNPTKGDTPLWRRITF